MPETPIHYSELDDDSRNMLAHYGCTTLNPVDETSKEAFWHTPRDYSREKVTALLSGNDELREWIDNRVELFQPLHVEIGSMHHYDATKIFNKADESLIKVLHEDWPLPLKKYALENLLNLDRRWMVDAPDQFKMKLNFIEQFVPRKIIDEGDTEVASILSGRVSFLQALQQHLSPRDIEQLFLDSEIKKYFYHLQMQSGVLVSKQSKEEYEYNQQRQATPVDFEDGMESKAKEITDVLAHSGLDEIAKLLVKKITAIHPELLHGYHGGYRSGEIEAGVCEDSRKYLLPLVAHELGHALQDRLAHSVRGHEWYDRYAVLTFTGPTQYSSYAMSFLHNNKVEQKEIDYNYLGESFAEDFKLFLLMPEKLQDKRRQIFNGICADIFPDIQLDELRKQLRETLGLYYSAKAKDVVDPTDCEHSKDMARDMDRRKSEGHRERVQRVINNMTHEEMLFWLEGYPENLNEIDDIYDAPVSVQQLYSDIKAGLIDQEVVLREIKKRLGNK